MSEVTIFSLATSTLSLAVIRTADLWRTNLTRYQLSCPDWIYIQVMLVRIEDAPSRTGRIHTRYYIMTAKVAQPLYHIQFVYLKNLFAVFHGSFITSL